MLHEFPEIRSVDLGKFPLIELKFRDARAPHAKHAGWLRHEFTGMYDEHMLPFQW